MMDTIIPKSSLIVSRTIQQVPKWPLFIKRYSPKPIPVLSLKLIQIGQCDLHMHLNADRHRILIDIKLWMMMTVSGGFGAISGTDNIINPGGIPDEFGKFIPSPRSHHITDDLYGRNLLSGCFE